MRIEKDDDLCAMDDLKKSLKRLVDLPPSKLGAYVHMAIGVINRLQNREHAKARVDAMRLEVATMLLSGRLDREPSVKELRDVIRNNELAKKWYTVEFVGGEL